MRFVSKVFLALFLVLWAVDYTPLGTRLYGIPKPLGVIFFGLFLITWIFPLRDFEQFEQDQAFRNQLIRNEREKRRREHRAHGRIHWKPREVHS